MSDRTSPRRINHKEKDPLAHLREEDTPVPKRKAFKQGKRRFEDDDEEYD